MGKKAVIDMGSLKMKVAIFDVVGKKLEASESHLTLLGKGIDEKGAISDESLQKLEDALKKTTADFKKQGIVDVAIIGTEALRKASNVDAVEALVEKYFPGHRLEVVDQEREAKLFFEAVSREFPDQPIVAMDIGGGSVQIIKGHFDSDKGKSEITERHNLKTGTYALQQKYSPDNAVISTGFADAQKVLDQAYQEVKIQAPVLVFGSSCMLDFMVSSGVKTHKDDASVLHPVYVKGDDLKVFLGEIKTLAPNSRDHYYPAGGYFMYGADYLLMNLITAIERMETDRAYPTNLNSSYAFI